MIQRTIQMGCRFHSKAVNRWNEPTSDPANNGCCHASSVLTVGQVHHLDGAGVQEAIDPGQVEAAPRLSVNREDQNQAEARLSLSYCQSDRSSSRIVMLHSLAFFLQRYTYSIHLSKL